MEWRMANVRKIKRKANSELGEVVSREQKNKKRRAKCEKEAGSREQGEENREFRTAN